MSGQNSDRITSVLPKDWVVVTCEDNDTEQHLIDRLDNNVRNDERNP